MSTVGHDAEGSFTDEPFGAPRPRAWWKILPHRPWRDPTVQVKLPNEPPADDITPATREYWAEILKVTQDIWKNEETRFSNLNSRAVALVSAASVITTLIAFFAKDLFEPARRPLAGAMLAAARVLTVGALGLFVLCLLVVVIGALMPGGRDVFANNAIAGVTARRTYLSGRLVHKRVFVTYPAGPLTPAQVDAAAATEYAGIYCGLARRNRGKAFAMGWGYLFLALGLLCAAIVAAMVVIWGNTPAG